MTEAEIKTRAAISLRPNKYFDRVDIPWLYQKRGVLMMLSRPRMVLGDDVGLGKTLQSVISFSYLKSQFPEFRALIFTEIIALDQWRDEFAKLTPDIVTHIVTADTHPDIAHRRAAYRVPAHVLITNYHSAYHYSDDILAGRGGRIAMYADEPTIFKNPKSKIHTAMKKLSLASERVYGLTATIVEHKLDDVPGVIDVIQPGFLPADEFAEKFSIRIKRCLLDWKNKDSNGNRRIKKVYYETVGYWNLGEFRKRLEPVYYGRLQSDPEVQQALPEVIEVDVPITMSIAQSKKVREATDRILTMPDGEVTPLTALSALTRAQQLCDDPALLEFDIPSAKTEALLEVLGGRLRGEKVIVFSRFRKLIDRLELAISALGLKVVRITGAESQSERDQSKADFQTGDAGVLLMTASGLKAVNLQAGRHFFWFDLPWSHSSYRQGLGRIKRTGSLHSRVVSYRMLGVMHPDIPGKSLTVDHHILSAVQSNAAVSNAIDGRTDTLAADDDVVMTIFGEVRKNA